MSLAAPHRNDIEAYLSRLGYPVGLDQIVKNNHQRPSTLCYIGDDEGRVLLLRRRKEPFKNHWTAPGGKMEKGETPEDAIVREVKEETGLTVSTPRLRAVCSEVGEANYNWLLFLFYAPVKGGVLTESDEGELRWFQLDQLVDVRLPSIDREILPYVFPEDERLNAFWPRRDTTGKAPWPAGPLPYIDVVYAPDHSVSTFAVQPLRELA